MDLILLGGFTGKEVGCARLEQSPSPCWGGCQYDHGFMKLAYGVGTVPMLVSLCWGAALL